MTATGGMPGSAALLFCFSFHFLKAGFNFMTPLTLVYFFGCLSNMIVLLLLSYSCLVLSLFCYSFRINTSRTVVEYTFKLLSKRRGLNAFSFC